MSEKLASFEHTLFVCKPPKEFLRILQILKSEEASSGWLNLGL